MATVTTSENAQESALEVAASARVYDGIHHAVAVAEPEHDLEQPGRHVARAAQCFYRPHARHVTCQHAISSFAQDHNITLIRVCFSSHATTANF